mgnify:CR=1 FL=1
MTYDEIKKNKEVCECLKKGNENLGVLGFTDHSAAHCTMVAKRAAYILKKFGYSESDVEMVKIAGFMHDIGNVVNRSRHAEYGAILANEILKETDMSLKDRITVVSAIGHHDESTGGATDPISAALIIADKTDVRRNRVRNKAKENFDIHDRVNYAVTDAKIEINEIERKVTLTLTIDTQICPVLDYVQIFMDRTMMSKYAAKYLNIWFELIINGTKLL